jgi:formiminoglutamate deiminase
MSRSVWCELAWLGGERPQSGVLIQIGPGGLIEEVHSGWREPPEGATRLAGLTLPALANAHSHSFQRALRGRTQQASGGSFWTWRERMYELARTLDVGAFESLARATFAEMALAGVGVVGEFHYLHHRPDGTPYEDPNELGWALIRAAAAAGIRLTLIDTCYLDGGLERFRDAGARAWCERVDALDRALAQAAGVSAGGERQRTGSPQTGAPATVRLGAAIHSVRAVDPTAAAMVAEFAAQRSWPLHAHVSEQPAENEQCLQRHGLSPLGLLERCGALSERFTAVHATHLREGDARLLSDQGACWCMCPTTERDLADGIGQPAGRIALGSDSHAVIDLFEEARAVELDLRLASGVRGHLPADALARAATAEGYACLGWPQGGRIQPGALADLTSVSLDSLRLAGIDAEHALAGAIFAAGAADVHSLIVGGRQVVRGGRHVELDVAAQLRRAVREAWRRP